MGGIIESPFETERLIIATYTDFRETPGKGLDEMLSVCIGIYCKRHAGPSA